MFISTLSVASVCSVDSIEGEQMVLIEYHNYTIVWDLINEQPEIVPIRHIVNRTELNYEK